MFHSLESLQEAVRSGKSFSYLLFWGHRPRFRHTVDDSCLSQWFPAGFENGGCRYPTAEHYMMAEKARMFNDAEIEDRVLASIDPAAAKKLGRQIANFDDELWQERSFDIVVRGNVAKFSQNESLRQFLIGTGPRILVEASPNDRVWGIGIDAKQPDARNPIKWQGTNKLGFALMVARDKILNGQIHEG